MKTTHKIVFGNANNMEEVPDSSIDLTVTSPPYPMIEMWDESFSKQNPSIGEVLAAGNGKRAFELMNKELDKVWKEVYRVLRNGGFACINIGDATRTLNRNFALYCNHSRILDYCSKLGFNSLPEILWRKQTNAPNKFMGSGMLPSGAYATLEHEYIIVLRKGNKREFKSKEDKLKRKQSAFFWEERNVWFSDIWEDLKGTKQANIDKSIRERSGAYPFELPYRIVNMFSLKGDIVLDPFLGTGTTTLACMTAARNSIGYEVDRNFKEHLLDRFKGAVDFSNQVLKTRIKNHLKFVKARTSMKGNMGYSSKYYGFPVMTNQETEIYLDEASRLIPKNCIFEVQYKEKPTM
jgi:DNA modification methylase